MSQTIRAIYENGVLVPLDTLTLTDHEQVRLIVESASISTTNGSDDSPRNDPLASIRVATGISDLAENFDDCRFGKRQP